MFFSYCPVFFLFPLSVVARDVFFCGKVGKYVDNLYFYLDFLA